MNPRRILLRKWKVDAIHKGATQLRVPIKDRFLDVNAVPQDCMNGFSRLEDGYAVWDLQDRVDSSYEYKVRCPYPVGSRLWVPETWQHEDMCCDDHRCGQPSHIYYKATEVAPETFARWRPASQMPEWASRILIEVTDVRCQQVQGISTLDMLAELGWSQSEGTCTQEFDTEGRVWRSSWDSTHSKPEEKWAANPWAWPLTFETLEGLA